MSTYTEFKSFCRNHLALAVVIFLFIAAMAANIIGFTIFQEKTIRLQKYTSAATNKVNIYYRDIDFGRNEVDYQQRYSDIINLAWAHWLHDNEKGSFLKNFVNQDDVIKNFAKNHGNTLNHYWMKHACEKLPRSILVQSSQNAGYKKTIDDSKKYCPVLYKQKEGLRIFMEKNHITFKSLSDMKEKWN